MITNIPQLESNKNGEMKITPKTLLEILRKIAFLNKKNELRPLHTLNEGLKK